MSKLSPNDRWNRYVSGDTRATLQVIDKLAETALRQQRLKALRGRDHEQQMRWRTKWKFTTLKPLRLELKWCLRPLKKNKEDIPEMQRFKAAYAALLQDKLATYTAEQKFGPPRLTQYAFTPDSNIFTRKEVYDLRLLWMETSAASTLHTKTLPRILIQHNVQKDIP